ncbi:MAG: PD-(D/E)XK nuclease family protein, partial [Anaerolineales bacterium]|nr:PD-(D/E)XK nuclease family protein [Anaerolineales bacterium]
RSGGTKIQIADSLLLDLRDEDFHPTAWQFAARHEDELEDAENRRLLYVAATRAKEKLIINGYVKTKKDGLSLNGWLSHFDFLENLSHEDSLLTDGIFAAIYPCSPTDVDSDSPQIDSAPQKESPRESDLIPPLAPNPPISDEKIRAHESDPPQRVWRIVSKTKKPRAPSWLVGRLVHEALRRWHFPDENFDSFLYPFALESGLTNEDEIRAAIHESRRMLERLRAHPLFKELNTAERHHELRYDLPDERGIIDLLYRIDSNWFIIDFKTDEVKSDEEAQSTIRNKEYNRQVERYACAIESQLGVKAKTRLVFLNVKDNISIFDV